MDALDWLDAVSSSEAAAALFRCCGSAGWASAMIALRPFGTPEALFNAAEREWAKASREDILEAFSHHPRIGDSESLRARFPGTHAWSDAEQSGVAAANERILESLAQGNRDYEDRFGHIFIVCASGQTAAGMLAMLQERLANEPADELKIAAVEQMKITRLRLERLLNEKGVEARA